MRDRLLLLGLDPDDWLEISVFGLELATGRSVDAMEDDCCGPKV
jgi:hypothetical protein